MTRPLVGFGAFAIAARLVLACGTILQDDPVDPIGGDASDADAAAPLADGSVEAASPPDSARVDVPDVVSECRAVFTDGFEPPDWADTVAQRWQTADDSPGTVSRTTTADLVHGGNGAARFVAPTDGFVHLARAIDDATCALTIDLWMMRVNGGSSTGLNFFELIAPGRARYLRHFAGFLHLDHETTDSEPSSSLEVSRNFGSDQYHHLVIKYEVSGAMTVTVDGEAPVFLGPSPGPAAAATRIRFGVLGTTGAPAPSEVVFDDVLIY